MEEEEEDIISTLPDPVLCHILSFLQTKHVVATTILSKRWNNLCHSLPTLYFNTHITDQNSNYDFNNFVYSVLVSRDATLPIKTFHLDLTYDQPLNQYLHHPINSITKWVNFVVQRRVEYLTLHLNAVGLPKLPTSILTCTTLVVLKLDSFSVDEGFSSVVLPSLKTLHLEDIWFPNLQNFMMFLSGCPNLEDLLSFVFGFDDDSLTYYEWKSFCFSNLYRADINSTCCYFPLKAVQNVTSLRVECYPENYLDDLIPTFHNLTQLELISLDYSWRFLIEVLNHCPKLQKLDLDQADSNEETWTRKDDEENWVDPDVVPQCLSLHLGTCNLFNFLGLQSELLLAKYILKNARVLQTMRIRNVGQTELNRLISSYPRASPMCKVTIVNVSIKQVGK